MKRVYYDVVEKYSDLSDKIKEYCKNDMECDYSDPNNYAFDFGDGFVEFIAFGQDYFANCGFLENAENVHEKCKQALAEIKGIAQGAIYAKVETENKRSASLINALGFKQIFKIYEYKD